MTRIPFYFILTIVLGQISCVVKSCGDNEDKITLFVSTQFFEQSIKSASSYTKTTRASTSFKKALKTMAVKADISVSYGLFSGSASASYDSLTDSVTSSDNYEETTKSEKIEFNTDFLQIIQETSTRVNINGRSASSSERKFVDSVPGSNSLSDAELTKRAEDYMSFLYGRENVTRNTFTETVCRTPNDNANSCGNDEDEITLFVSTQFYEQSVKAASSYTKTTRSSKSFKKTLSTLAANADLSVSYGLFSGSASASYESLTESVSSSDKYEDTIKEEKTEFNTDFLQIIREILTRVTINGRSASTYETKFVDTVPASKSLSGGELIKRAKDYMVSRYGQGKAIKNTFTETVCQKRTTTLVASKQIWYGGVKYGMKQLSCWNPVGNNMLASIPSIGNDRPEQSFIFGGSPGAFDKPNDYSRTWLMHAWGSHEAASFWQPKCNDGYVALGDYCQQGHAKPSTSAMRCVRKDLTVECEKTKIWTDEVFEASWRPKVTVYKTSDSFVQGMITQDHGDRQAYCLK